MNEIFLRLSEAAKRHGAIGNSSIARLLNESPQVVTNWSKRGVPAKKLIEVAPLLGVTPEWLQFGKESKVYNVTYHGDSDVRNYIQPAHLVGDEEIEVNDSEEADLLRAFRQLTANQRTDLLKTALDVVAKNDDLLEQLLARKKA
jgi:hypothetical protein